MNNEELQNQEELNKIKDNGVLLISEVQNKVFLPYTAEEIKQAIESKDNRYETPEEVIRRMYTKSFKNYRYQFAARFRETVELITKREKMSLKDGIDLATELCVKRYLHPAVIAACKNLDELNVYIDCLNKNELDDFKIFKIEYEITPLLVKDQNDLYSKTSFIQKIAGFMKKIFAKRNRVEGKHLKV